MDYRGRGLSEHAADYKSYNLQQEADDIDRGIKALGIDRFALIGTSRGGLHAFSMAERYADRISSIILNDIGPVIEQEALIDIVLSVGTAMNQPTMKDAAERLQSIHAACFTKLTEADWITFANQTYIPTPHGVSLCYDKRLGDAVRDKSNLVPNADLWAAFANLKRLPHLLLLGENSRLLSASTAQKMKQLHDKLELFTVKDEGHAPLLWDQPTQTRIREFINQYL